MNQPPRVRMAAFLWDAFVLHIGDRIAAPMHALAAVQVMLGIGERVAVRIEDSAWVEGDCIVVGSNVRHALRGGRFAMFWIEPESDAGRRLIATYCRCQPFARIEVPRLEVHAVSASRCSSSEVGGWAPGNSS